ncbi:MULTISPECIES: sigma-70 family RNA polymerase sigma factor [unclassified Microbacterium]|uniref:sigma-70 family RNA polymerase sigma factor n=1 Tax=unclassified Microbacterium TaxID=2609290 RepID=UPI003867C3E6
MSPTRDASSDAALAALLVKIAGADAAAFAALYDATGGLSFSLAVRVTGDRGLAEEVVREVFVEIWRDATSFDPGRDRAVSWIVSLTRRRAIDAVRALRAANADEAALPLRVDGDEIQAHIADLSVPQQRVLALAYFGGHSQSEIARLSGHPVGTVKSHMREALDRLRAASTAAEAAARPLVRPIQADPPAPAVA